MGTSRSSWFNPFRNKSAQSVISAQNDQNALVNHELTEGQN